MPRETNGRARFQPETVDLKGKVAIITGGTTGIGRATAGLLANEGVKVVITGRNEGEMQDALHDLQENGAQVHGVIADSAAQEQIDRVFEETHRRFGLVDILMNNAAVAAQTIIETDYDRALYALRVNILGYLWYTRRAVEDMRRNGGGHIINIGSMSSQVRETKSDLYVASKSAIQGVSESLRKWLGEEGIRVSLIEPGSVGSNLQVEPPDIEGQERDREKQQMLEAEDIAYAVHYILTTARHSNVLQLDVAPVRQAI